MANTRSAGIAAATNARRIVPSVAAYHVSGCCSAHPGRRVSTAYSRVATLSNVPSRPTSTVFVLDVPMSMPIKTSNVIVSVLLLRFDKHTLTDP